MAEKKVTKPVKTTKETKPVKTVKIAKATKPTAQSNLEIPVYGLKGTEVKKMSLSKEIFQTKVNEKLLAQYVRVYLQNQRQGNASAKTRGEVAGTTKKVYRQKGTGGARHGSRKAPIFVGGGVTFGPLPHSFSLSMSKKQKKAALFSSLSLKVKQGTISALENAVLEMKPKTKTVAQLLKNAGLANKKLLIVVPELRDNGFVLSIRNIPNIQLMQAVNINPYAIMNNAQTLFVEGAFEVLEKHFLKQNED